MSPTTYVVTGANRGIGIELVKHLLAHDADARVIATARNPDKADDLQAVVKANAGRAATIKLDLNDIEGIKAAATEAAELAIAANGIDVLINNAGIFAGGFDDILAPDAVATLQDNLNVNAVGTLAVTQAFLPLLRQGVGKKIWNVSTGAAQFVGGFSAYPVVATYAASKAATNMISVKFARALEPEQFTVLALHPGRVDTEMGKNGAEISAAESAEKSIATFASKTPAQSGTFWSYTGEELTW